MSTFLEILNQRMAHGLGWALLRRASPDARYLAGCVSLVVLVAAPVLTSLWLSPPLAGEFEPAHSAVAPGEIYAKPSAARFFRANVSAGTSEFISGCGLFLERRIPWLVGAWLIGVSACSWRLLQGCRRVHRLELEGIGLFDLAWLKTLEQLKHRLKVSRPVRLLKSARVDVPTVIGWLRPVILLPAASVAGLSPAPLEAILAHELAHIRRHDYAVNLIQNVIETLMFYHPAVWWISNCIREEREHCCDDLAVAAFGDRVRY